MQTLEALGGETWFRLGDADLALHVERTQRLKGGAGLSAIAADLARRLGIEAAIVPVSDDPIRTRIATSDGELAFQDYFVRHRCAPRVQDITYQGAAAARLAPPALAALSPRRSRPSSSAPPIPTGASTRCSPSRRCPAVRPHACR
jgi:LPPG:FO 2-phospho-L-lactate transferase